jgi:DNA-binding XRE family transcriptional regulator
MAGRGIRMDTLKARRLSGSFTVSRLAKLANVSDQTITILENGGTTGPDEAGRILNALCSPITLTSNTQASPTVFTASSNTLVTGDTVTIAGVSDADADPNGSRVVTVVNGTSFSVPVNCGVSAGTGGTATLGGASVTQTSQL